MDYYSYRTVLASASELELAAGQDFDRLEDALGYYNLYLNVLSAKGYRVVREAEAEGPGDGRFLRHVEVAGSAHFYLSVMALGTDLLERQIAACDEA